MHPIILVFVFMVATTVGYLIIKNVPTLLHTPLMSGMNALSGITILGAIIAVGLTWFAVESGTKLAGQLLGGLAVIATTVNVVGGFGITHRMLKMFNKKKPEKADKL